MARQAALATITVQLREATAVARADSGLAGDLSAAYETLLVVARRLATVAIWLVVWLPLYALPFLAVRLPLYALPFLAVRLLRRRLRMMPR
jgi:hypothetical protein